jgi:hypothetical protein
MLLLERMTREQAARNPGVLFVFGDNLARAGFGGQAAELRGARNAVGIPTKRAPRRDEAAYFCDADLEAATPAITAAFERLRQHLRAGGDVVWPVAGVGTGLAELPRRAPAIAAFIEAGRTSLVALSAAIIPGEGELR